MVDATNIKNIVPKDLATVQEVDEGLEAVRKAIAVMSGQLDFALMGGTKTLHELSPKDQVWFLNLKSAKRHAKRTASGLNARRDELLRTAGGTLEEIVTALQGAEFDDTKVNPTITLVVLAKHAQRWLRNITGIIPTLKSNGVSNVNQEEED